MGKPQEIGMKCPFCNIGNITIIHIPSSIGFRKGPYGGGRAGIVRSTEKTIIVDEKCQSCGKTNKEISKALETGNIKQLTHEDTLKRFKDSGLPLVFESRPKQ